MKKSLISWAFNLKQNSVSSVRNSIRNDIHLLRRASKKISSFRDQALFRLFLETGFSVKEIIELKVINYEFTTCSLMSNGRKIKLPLDLSLLLNNIIDNKKPYVFYTKKSVQLTNTRVFQIINYWSQKFFNKKLSPQDLRKVKFGVSDRKEIKTIINIKTREFLSVEQLDNIRSNILNKQHQLIFDIFVETGCNVSDLIEIKIDDIKQNKIEFKDHISTLGENLSLRLNEFIKGLKQDNYLFSTRQSPKFSDKRIFQLVKKYALHANIRGVNLRILRSTCVALMRQNNLSNDEISTQTGIQNLEHYQYGVLVKKQ